MLWDSGHISTPYSKLLPLLNWVNTHLEDDLPHQMETSRLCTEAFVLVGSQTKELDTEFLIFKMIGTSSGFRGTTEKA